MTWPRPSSKQTLSRLAWVVLATLLALTAGGAIAIAQRASRRAPATGERVSFEHGGRVRHYRIHVPKKYDGKRTVPLVFCFHGGGGNAEVGSRMGFTPIAEEEGFIVVYPEGLNKHWNDGRKSQKFVEQDAEVDDVAFVLALLEKLQNQFRIDSKRVYVTGASNGGFFSHRLAIEASDKFAAAAVMIATLPKPFETNFKPKRPIPILFMNGTDDPFVPYNGGPITPNFTPRFVDSKTREFGRGECTSTDTAVKLWLTQNGLSETQPTVSQLPDKAPRDGCRVERRHWSGGREGSEVVLYRIEGGGHTIPGKAQYLPQRIIGPTCRDFDGLRTIWQFFKRHSR